MTDRAPCLSSQFATLMAHLMANEEGYEAKVEKLKGAFHVFDQDGDGTISFFELRNIMINLGEQVQVEDIDDVIRKVRAAHRLASAAARHPGPHSLRPHALQPPLPQHLQG